MSDAARAGAGGHRPADADVPRRGVRANALKTGPGSRQPLLDALEVPLLDLAHRRQVVDADGHAVLLQHRIALQLAHRRQRQELSQGDDAFAERAENPFRPGLVHVVLAASHAPEYARVDALS